MSGEGVIQTSSEAVSTHSSAISSYGGSMYGTLREITGGTADSITDVNEVATSATQILQRYAVALPRSVNDIAFIAERLQAEDAQQKERFTGGAQPMKF